MSNERDPDLAFYQNDELLAELFSRFDNVIFLGTLEAIGDEDYHHAKWKGKHAPTVGLCGILSYRIQEYHKRTSRPCDGPDDPSGT